MKGVAPAQRPIHLHDPWLGHQLTVPLTRLEGWGGVRAANVRLCRPTDLGQVQEVFLRARRADCSVALRGAGRSYGDATLNEGGFVIDLSRMNRVQAWDAASGILTVEPGVTIRQMWQTVLPDGYWPPVVTGTMETTAGGCAAMNVHGKNNFKVGCFGDHVLDFDLLLASGDIIQASRKRNSELFHAALGGLGLLGCFARLRLKMMPVESGLLDVRVQVIPNIKGLLTEMERQAGAADYLVGWIDGAATGLGLGRGILHTGTQIPADQAADGGRSRTQPAQALPRAWMGLPFSFLKHFLKLARHEPGIRLLNSFKYRATELGTPWHAYRQGLAQYSFLLDYIPEWRQAFSGLIQYQCILPKAEALGGFEELLRVSQAEGLTPGLGVVKKHRPDGFLFSYALDGYSLALEYPANADNQGRLGRLADRFDQIVGERGGKIYLAKNISARPELIARMIPPERAEVFFRLKDRLDPAGLVQHDLYRRLLPFLG